MKKIVALFLAVIMLLSSAALAEVMTAGTYQASAQGYHGSIVLKVTVDADKITGIEVVEQSETEGIGAAALPMLVEAVLANQTIGVDAVTGATITSDGFKAAMKDALTQAGADMDKMTAAAKKERTKGRNAGYGYRGCRRGRRGLDGCADRRAERPLRNPAGKDGHDRRRERYGGRGHDCHGLPLAARGWL